MSEFAPETPLILVVEDDAVVRMVASDILAMEGYRVEEAEDAETALRILEGRPDIELLFTDINMPGDKDGLALAREVHERWPQILLILTSGRAYLEKAEIPDDGRFVPKPYNASKLISSVRDVISSHTVQ